MKMKDRLIVALDVLDKKKCLALIDELSPAVNIFKVGIAPFTGFGEAILKKLEAKKKKVFLDLKFHDIPNTVRNAACIAAEKNVFMMNFHCVGGLKMLREAAEGAEEGARKAKKKRPLIIGVTVLTSMDDKDIAEIGMHGTVKEKVLEFANLAKNAGLDGVVASAHEIKLIKEHLGGSFVVVTPGIRPYFSVSGDQKRVVTPGQAMECGADYIVVGRPIIEDKKPLLAAKKVIKEMETLK